MINSLQFYALGESAITIQFNSLINTSLLAKIHQIKNQILTQNIVGVLEIVSAYNTITIYYNPIVVKDSLVKNQKSIFENFCDYLKLFISQTPISGNSSLLKGNNIEIPVCYDPEFGFDLPYVAESKNVDPSEIIRIHTSSYFTVFAVGFLPGFPYLGILPPSLQLPRKKTPLAKVPAQSVAIASNQTGIYPIESPGGWHIIGKTPLPLFNIQKQPYFLFSPCDIVKFKAIDKHEFYDLQNQQLVHD